MAHVQTEKRWIDGLTLPGIRTIGDPFLRTTLPAIPPLELAPLAQRVVESLRSYRGACLTALQIGLCAPILVVEVRKTDLFPDRPETPLIVMLSPKIESLLPPIEEDWEGCFSVPGYMGLVPRYHSVQVAFDDLTGRRHSEVFTGYVARVVQHGLDVLEGKLFLDRMRSLSSLTTVKNWQDLHTLGPEAPPLQE
jgi:peptide deformylase